MCARVVQVPKRAHFGTCQKEGNSSSTKFNTAKPIFAMQTFGLEVAV